MAVREGNKVSHCSSFLPLLGHLSAPSHADTLFSPPARCSVVPEQLFTMMYLPSIANGGRREQAKGRKQLLDFFS